MLQFETFPVRVPFIGCTFYQPAFCYEFFYLFAVAHRVEAACTEKLSEASPGNGLALFYHYSEQYDLDVCEFKMFSKIRHRAFDGSPEIVGQFAESCLV